MKHKLKVAAGGAAIGIIAVILVVLGNPKNMGFCIACFLRDTAGALGMHKAEVVQYVRPEIIGLVLGAFVCSLIFKEFSARAGSSPVTRFVLGFLVMICALVFLGCPLRMVLRIAGGDLNAIIGLAGFAVGIGGGILFLNKGFNLRRTYKLHAIEGIWLNVIQVVLLIVLVGAPGLLLFSEKGPGSMRAPILAALVAGVAVGVIAQRTRICMVGGIRDAVLFKDFTLLIGFGAIIVTAMIGNLATGNFSLGFMGQPVAHIDGIWNFVSMMGTGLGCVMLGGCPLRQLILAGEGNADSAITVIGMTIGAAFAHNFKLASAATAIAENGDIVGGPTLAGKIAVVVSICVMIVIAVLNVEKSKKEKIK